MHTKNKTVRPTGRFFLQQKDVISMDQFDASLILSLCKKADSMKQALLGKKPLKLLEGTISVLLFYEPSSRTFSSFSAAIKRLGGQTIEYQNPMQTSSAVKGETLEDTIRVFENYADLIVLRHPEQGAALRAAQAAEHVPIINAGDGAGEHPTQALMDMYTLHQTFGRLEYLTGLFAGDLLYGRTVHSLMKGLSQFKNNTLYLLAPNRLEMPSDLISEMKKKGLTISLIEDTRDIPSDCNFWYWTRVQKERFSDQNEYEELKHRFILTSELLEEKGNKDMVIMHPLPRVGEIEVEVDADPRAIYLNRQIKNGVYMRMAIISLLLRG